MNRTCNKCGWVHFSVTRHYAETEVQQFNEYFAGLSKEEQDDFYGGTKSSIVSYERCFFCGNVYTDFRKSKEDDCPVGCTLGPIIYTP